MEPQNTVAATDAFFEKQPNVAELPETLNSPPPQELQDEAAGEGAPVTPLQEIRELQLEYEDQMDAGKIA
jgi:hypothetical protein